MIQAREESRPQDITQETFESYIEAVNTAISDFDMEIRSTVHQTTRQRTYALINSVSDPVTQLATGFPPDEISYIKRVLDAMFDTNNTLRNEVMAIQPIQATKLHRPPVNRRETIDGETQGSTGTHITILQAEKVLSSMVEQGWFEKSRKNYYSLSPRALMELRGWLQETYNDEEDDDEGGEGDIPKIKFCHACKEIVTYVSIVGGRVILSLLISTRANAVLNFSAFVDFMILAQMAFSERKGQKLVLAAKLNGQVKILLAREQLLRRRKDKNLVQVM